MNCRLRNAFAARIMMTRPGEAKTSGPPKSCVGGNCLVPSGSRTSSGNPRLRCQGQACGGRAIGHPNRHRHRDPESASLSGARRDGARRSRIGHWRYSPRSVVPGAREEGNHPNDLARSATKKALIQNRDFQNETVAPASRRQFLYSRRDAKLPVPLESGQSSRWHHQTRAIFREISGRTQSDQRDGRS